MGGEQPKPAKPKPTIDEIIIEMRMSAKRFEHDSKRAEKDKKTLYNKAKECLKKGNEEGAKLYLTNAATKEREQKQMLRMSNKMEALATFIKGNSSNLAMVDSLNKITPLLASSANIPIEQLYVQTQQFEQAMDQLNIQGQVMGQVLQQNQGDVNQDQAVDQMLMQLKQEQLNEIRQDLNQNNQVLFNDLQQQNQAANNDKAFINDLKKI